MCRSCFCISVPLSALSLAASSTISYLHKYRMFVCNVATLLVNNYTCAFILYCTEVERYGEAQYFFFYLDDPCRKVSFNFVTLYNNTKLQVMSC